MLIPAVECETCKLLMDWVNRSTGKTMLTFQLLNEHLKKANHSVILSTYEIPTLKTEALRQSGIKSKK